MKRQILLPFCSTIYFTLKISSKTKMFLYLIRARSRFEVLWYRTTMRSIGSVVWLILLRVILDDAVSFDKPFKILSE
jgi:hypothetical protein